MPTGYYLVPLGCVQSTMATGILSETVQNKLRLINSLIIFNYSDFCQVVLFA